MHFSLQAFLLLLLMSRQDRSRKICFRKQLTTQGKRRRDRRISRRALLSPSLAPFTFLFNSVCDKPLITLTGLDHKAFRYLLNVFAPLYYSFTPYSQNGLIKLVPIRKCKRGRPRSLNAVQCLGLVLAWTRTRGSEMVLSLLFGATTSFCSLFLRFSRPLVMRVLCNDVKAAVKMPSEQETKMYQAAFESRHSLLNDIYAVADGVKVYLEQAGDTIIQEMFYNGWKHDHYIGSVLVFCPAVLIVACAVNAPGSMHDSQISEWGGIYDKLQRHFDKYGGRVVVDSAFSSAQHSFLLKSAQDCLGTSETPINSGLLR